MARLHADGFDHYGTDETNMLDNVYANAKGGTGPTGEPEMTLTTAQVATGTHSVLFRGPSIGQLALRYVLPTSKTKVGAAARFFFPSLPDENGSSAIFSFNSSTANVAQLLFYVDSNGAIRVYRGYTNSNFGGGGTLIATTDPLISSGAWNHIEIQCNISDTAGWVRIAINGVHRYASATNLDTQHDSTGVVSVSHGVTYNPITGNGKQFYMDDLIIYDFVGDSAVDTDFCPATDGSGVATSYIGELQCMWLVPNADTAEDDWTPSTGSDAYAMIDEVDPNDADYISSVANTDLSEFAITDLPPEITYIRGVDVWGRMSKSDSGAAFVKFGMKSVAATSDSAEFPITVEPAYWRQQSNIDPNSSARWTRASLNAAWVRLLRTV